MVLICDLIAVDTRPAEPASIEAIPALVYVASEIDLFTPSVEDAHLVLSDVHPLWSESVIEAVLIRGE
jgi:hypothetical protein